MKWVNKGHEFEKEYAAYKNNFSLGKGVYIFGAGQLGKHYGAMFAEIGILKGYIDNYLAGGKCNGMPVISFEEYLASYKGIPIILCLSVKNREQIAPQLENAGLQEDIHFVNHTDYMNIIFPILMMYERDRLLIPLCQICVTERCSLKCKKCAHACHMVANNIADLKLDDVKHSADSYFRLVDYAAEFVLIGGEPLLYRDLAEAVAYIGKKYRRQIGIFSITTNGTIIPKDEVLEECRKHNVLFRISNYEKSIPRLVEKHKELVQKLKDLGVNFVLGKDDRFWMDYGFEYVDRHHIELEKTFDVCATPCHEVRRDRFYQCVMARTVSENMYHIECEDYLDLSKLDGADGKKVLLEYSLGYSDKGFMEMCNRCNGADSVNHPIPVAEQW